ncbi:MAG TPA: hypothetical protein VMY79_01215 [Dehalococcoidia bacterium]|nr:hypothetical protein [Dehalococcoidia bacterium]
MRTLTDTLKAAQQAGAKNVLYKIVLTKGTTTYTYGKDRILPSEHDEAMYSHRASIVLSNHDHTLDSLDLKGFDAVISYGVVSKAGDEYSATAPLTVIDQQFDSAPNKLTCTLELEGMPNLMAEDEASDSYVPDEDADDTVKDLVNAIVGATLDCFSLCEAYEVVWDDGYDTLADTYKPKDGFRIYTGGSRLAALRRLLDYTANVPRFEADGKVHILKPVTTGESYDYEYDLESGHPFFSKAYRNSLVFPNKIYVISRDDDDPQCLGVAQTSDYNSLPSKVKKIKYIQVRLKDNGQADDIAEALIAKTEMGCKRGQAEVPLNVAQEVFDYVKVTDQRQGDTRPGNLGYVHRRFGKDKWAMTFGFGNWLDMLRYRGILKELETYTDAGQYFSRLSVDNLYAKHIQADSLDMVWIDPEGNIDLSQIGDTLDNLPDGEVYARVKSMHLDAGVLQLDEHVIYKGAYNPSTKFDLGLNDFDDIPEGTVFRRTKSAALTADGLVVMDNVVVGTYGKIKTASLSASGLVLLDQTVDGTYGKILKNDIYSGHVIGTAIVQSSTARLVTDAQKAEWNASYDLALEAYDLGVDLRDDIVAGYLTLSQYTNISGTWYNTGGVYINASTGIKIFGGKLTLANSAGQYASSLYIDTGGQLRLDPWTYTVTANIMPLANLTHKLGDPTKRWQYIYCNILYGGKYSFTETKADLADLEYMELPRRTSAPAGYEGRMVYNHSTGYLNVYSSGAWWHANRDAGWA